MGQQSLDCSFFLVKSPGEIIVRSRSPALTQGSSSRGFIYNGNDLKLDENWAASSLSSKLIADEFV